MKKVILIFCLLPLFLFSYCCHHKTATSMNKKEEPVIVEGKIITEMFTNKIGRPNPKIYEYYLLVDDKQYFIKFTNESEVKKEDLDKIIDKNAKFKVYLRNGAWDSDSPHVQGRYGDYVVILQIVS